MGQQHSRVVESLIAAVVQFAQSEAIKAELAEWIRSSRSVNIFVSGKTGSGKSTLVNALLGRKVAKEGRTLDPMTSQVTCHEETAHGIRVQVWDSPGLQDGTGKEAEYIADMKAKCKDIDLCVFCINISTARFKRNSKEVQALVKLTDAFGHSLWDHAVIALTFANELEIRNDEMMQAKQENNKEKLCKLFQDKIAEWDNTIRTTLTDMIELNHDCVRAVSIIPAGFQEPVSLPDRNHWLSSFWFGTVRSMNKKAQPAMVILNMKRLVKSQEHITQEEYKKVLEEQSLIFSERGYEVGCQVGSPELGKQMGALLCHEVHALVLIDLLDSILSTLQENLESVARGPDSTSACSGADTKG